MEKKIIDGIKAIYHNASGINVPDDPSYPYKITAVLSLPEYMEMAYMFLIGPNETVIVRGKTMEAIKEFIKCNGLIDHPRLLSMVVYGPDGEIKEQVFSKGR
jgi:hypothetical protein